MGRLEKDFSQPGSGANAFVPGLNSYGMMEFTRLTTVLDLDLLRNQ